jgi:hypothetical protein
MTSLALPPLEHRSMTSLGTVPPHVVPLASPPVRVSRVACRPVAQETMSVLV